MFKNFLAALFLIVIFSGSVWADSNSYVELKSWGKADLVHPGVFSDDRFELAYSGGRWIYWNNDERGELKAPYECDYSERRNLRLESTGRVFLVSKDNRSDRVEVRVIDEEWQYNADGDWSMLLGW